MRPLSWSACHARCDEVWPRVKASGKHHQWCRRLSNLQDMKLHYFRGVARAHHGHHSRGGEATVVEAVRLQIHLSRLFRALALDIAFVLVWLDVELGLCVVCSTNTGLRTGEDVRDALEVVHDPSAFLAVQLAAADGHRGFVLGAPARLHLAPSGSHSNPSPGRDGVSRIGGTKSTTCRKARNNRKKRGNVASIPLCNDRAIGWRALRKSVCVSVV